MCGLNDGYDEWLGRYLESENPLSDIVLDLSLCGSDINKIVSCLHDYCGKQDFDEKQVCEKLRLFLKDAYHSGRFSKDEVISYMYRFSNSHGDPFDFEEPLWYNMYYMDYYYSLTEDGIIPRKKFDCAFLSYLNNGIPIDKKKIWNYEKKTPGSMLRKILNFFRKK